MTNEEKLNAIKEIVKFNMSVSCGMDCTKTSCLCQNKQILDIIEKD